MRKILEDLIFIGEVKETYTVCGKQWVLKTLTSEEQLTATASTRDYDNISRVNALKRAYLARSIIEVDNIPLRDINEKIEFLGTLQQPIIDLLYDKYLDVQKKQDEELKDFEDDLKN